MAAQARMCVLSCILRALYPILAHRCSGVGSRGEQLRLRHLAS